MDNKGFTDIELPEKSKNGLKWRKADGSDSSGSLEPEPEIQVEKVKLKKTVGLISGTSLIVGTIIGSGIFVSPASVLDRTGSVGMSLVVWTLSGILALLGSLCYSELGTMIKKSGGEYAYLKEAFGDIPAFLFSWTSVIVIRTSSMAIISLTFAEYMSKLFPYCGSPEITVKLVAITVIVTLAMINSFDTRLAARVQVFFTAVKLLALMVIVVFGIIRLAQGHTTQLTNSFEGTTSSPSYIALAFYNALWAYDGWNNLNYVTEEIENPEKNLPRANLLGVIIVTVVYILTNISYLTAMTSAELLTSSAVAVAQISVMTIRAVWQLLLILVAMDDTIKISNITSNSDQQSVAIIATVTSRTEVKKWSRNKTSGDMLCGVLADNTAKIDFVCWTEASKTFDAVLIERLTYKIKHANVVMAKKQFTKTQHVCQLVFDTDTTVELIDLEPFSPPLTLTKIAELRHKSDYEKLNVLGKVVSLPPPELLPNTNSEILKVRIQDKTGVVQMSLFGENIKKCNFAINDIFMSLSANDFHWYDNFKFINPDLSDSDIENLLYSEKCKILRDNSILSAIHFRNRWEAFLYHFILSTTKPLGQVDDYYARVEFQARGSPHLHILLWIHNAPDFTNVIDFGPIIAC